MANLSLPVFYVVENVIVGRIAMIISVCNVMIFPFACRAMTTIGMVGILGTKKRLFNILKN